MYGAAKISHEEKVMQKFSHLRKVAMKISQMKKSDARFSHKRKGDAKFIFSLVQLPLNGYNFFISAPICTPFEALDSWLPDLRNDINNVYNGLQEVL